jgi:hypothetical protein
MILLRISDCGMRNKNRKTNLNPKSAFRNPKYKGTP